MDVAGVSYRSDQYEGASIPIIRPKAAAKPKAKSKAAAKPRVAKPVGTHNSSRGKCFRKWLGRAARARSTINKLQQHIKDLKKTIDGLRVRNGRFITPRGAWI